MVKLATFFENGLSRHEWLVSFLRDDARLEAADVRVGGLGDGEDGAGPISQRGGQGSVHLSSSL